MAGKTLRELSLLITANAAKFTQVTSEVKAKTLELNNATKKAGGDISKNFKTMSSEASKALSEISGNFGTFGPIVNNASEGIKSMSVATKLLNTALGPIGIIITAVGVAVKALSSYFTKTSEGARTFSKIMGVLKGVLSVVEEVFINLGKKIVKFFEDPKESIKSLVATIKNYFVNTIRTVLDFFSSAFSAIKNGFAGVGKAIEGLFNEDAKKESKEYFAQMKKDIESAGQAVGTLFSPIKEVVDGAKEFGKKIADAGREGGRLNQRLYDVKLKIKDLENEEKKIALEIAKNEKIAEDRSKSKEERLQAISKIEELVNSSTADRVALLKEEYSLKERLLKLDGEISIEEKDELDDIEGKINDTLREREEKLTTVNNLRNRINGKAEDELSTEKDIVDKVKEEKDALNAIVKLREKTLNDINEISNEIIDLKANLGEISEKDLIKIKSNKSIEEALNKIKDLTIESENAERKIVELQNSLNSDSTLTDEQRNIYSQEIEELKKFLTDSKLLSEEYNEWILLNEKDTNKQISDIIKREEEEKAEIKARNLEKITGIVSSVTDTIGSLFEAQKNREIAAAGDSAEKKAEIEKKYAKKEKAITLSRAIIGTAMAVINALQTKPFLPFGPIMAGIAAAAGAAQIAAIASAQFAEGGYVTKPTYALIGEKGPEWILNRDQMLSLVSRKSYQPVEIYGQTRIDGKDLLIWYSNAQKYNASY